MTFSYSGDPASSNLDAVRFAIGDTDSVDPLLTDEEINYLLVGSTVNSAALGAVRGLAAKAAREVDRQVGNLRVSASQRAAGFTALAVRLEALVASGAGDGLPFASGVSYEAKQDIYDDGDRIPSFTARAAFPVDYGVDRYGSR